MVHPCSSSGTLVPNGRRKLTALDADRIRMEYEVKKTSQRRLAIRYGVSQMAIWQVLSGRTFRGTS